MKGQVVLERLGISCLYQPVGDASDGKYVFLLWGTENPPEKVTLDETWSESGVSKKLGYHVYLKASVTSSNSTIIETILRATLPGEGPKATSIMWVSIVLDPETITGMVDFSIIVNMTFNASGFPALLEDVNITLPANMNRIGFGKGAPILVLRDEEGFIQSFIVTYPPIDGAMTPINRGILLPMIGEYIGCLQFDGLVGYESFGSGETIKTKVKVQVDPLEPFLSSRTRIISTAEKYLLISDGGGYQLRPYQN